MKNKTKTKSYTPIQNIKGTSPICACRSVGGDVAEEMKIDWG